MTTHGGIIPLDRRQHLKPDEKSLLQKLQRGTWTLAELEWLERHLRPDAPTILVAEVRHRLQTLRRTHAGNAP